jgi:hypothetical protein
MVTVEHLLEELKAYGIFSVGKTVFISGHILPTPHSLPNPKIYQRQLSEKTSDPRHPPFEAVAASRV